MVNKRDTLDYNAAAFATRPMAVVEDLLRRLPGIIVETDGTIKAQGETVSKVLVDGKEFFGSDPSIVSKNLPANAVKRVQVYDKQSDMAEFTGILDGNEQKAINLILKDDAKVGYFGQASGGGGGDLREKAAVGLPDADRTRYTGAFSLNRFTASTQLAAIVNLNNINQTGFAWSDFSTFIGGAKGMMAGGMEGINIGGGRDDGFTKTAGLGFNASHDFGGNNWIRSSYFLSNLDNRQDQVTQQQLLQGSSLAAFSNSSGAQETKTLTHRVNLNAQKTFAPGHDLRFRADFRVTDSELLTSGSQRTNTSTGAFQNSALSRLSVDGTDPGGNASLTWRKRLDKTGRSIVGEANIVVSRPELDGNLASTTQFADKDTGIITTADLLQQQLNRGETVTHNERVSLTQPLGKGGILELFGQYSAVSQDQTKTVSDLGSGTPIVNDLLSSQFERTYSYVRGGFRLNRNSEALRWTVGLQLQGSNLEGKIINRNESIQNGYTHLLPTANARVQLSEGKTLDLGFSTNTQEPSMTQLQPFVDNVNPLYIYSGNPDLQPSYSRSIRGSFRQFDQFSFSNFQLNANAGYTSDRITIAREIDGSGKQTVMPVNSPKRNYNANLSMNYGRPIRPFGARISLDYGISYSSGLEYLNGEENNSRTIRHSSSLSLDNRNKEVLDLRIGAKLSYTLPHYDLNEALNQPYFTNTYYGSGSYYLSESWTLQGNMEYRTFDQQLFGPSENVTLLGASVGRTLMGGRAEMQLLAADLLNQNTGVKVNASASSIQEQRIQTLGRHLIARFTYKLGSSYGGGGKRGMGGRAVMIHQ